MKKLTLSLIFALLLSVTSFASAVFSLSDAECTAGDNVKLTLTLACTSKGNSFAVSDIQYDETALEFKGFTPNEALAEMTVLPPVFDSDKRVIVVGFSEVSAFDGVLCTLEFAVKETAKSGEYEISARTVAKSFSNVLESSFKAGHVKVKGKATKPSSPTVTPTKPKEWKNPFTDVTASDWFYSAVRYTNENGIINGVSEREFAPTLRVTRAMFVTLLYRLEGESEVAKCKFEDVMPGVWYEKAVAWANEKGIVGGVSETEFAPDSNITREQMATMLFRFAKYKGKGVATEVSLGYSDKANVSPWAMEGVAWATQNGVMSGSGNEFLPKNFATRAEAATVIMRMGK